MIDYIYHLVNLHRFFLSTGHPCLAGVSAAITLRKEEKMQREQLQKLLAGLGIATLIAGAGLSAAENAWAA